MRRKVLKGMGYLSDQQGIINRYLSEQGGWDSHLLRCRQYIREAVERIMPESITLLGSGWLLDIPLEELSELNIPVTLVDIEHPVQIRRKAGKFNNVNLVNADITGGLAEIIWNLKREKIESLSDIEVPFFEPPADSGLFVSANLLTQLDTLITEFLVNGTSLSNEEYRSFRKKIQENHITFLKSRSSVLITDYREEIYRDDEKTGESELLFTSLPEGKNSEYWDWDFDTRGLYYSGKRVIFKVIATEFGN